MANEEVKTQLLEQVKEKVGLLKKQGGFKILEGVIDGRKGIRDLNPKDEPRRMAFLSDNDKAEKRKKLKEELTILKKLITSENPIETARKESENSEKTLSENLREAMAATRDLEKSYRSLDLFFRNAQEENIRNLYIINMPVEEFASQDNGELGRTLDKHFKENFDRLSLEDNYSLFVIPGYLGDNLEYWSQKASDYRITLLTDFTDEKEFESVLNQIEEEKLCGEARYLANTVLTCNYGIVRRKNEGIEDDDLALPMSIALAGKMYSATGIQPPAGKKHGKLHGVIGTRMAFLRTHVDVIDKVGMIPIIYEKQWGTVAMSDTTLCSESSDPDLRALGVVRAKDWIAKVLLDYFNGLTFQVYSGALRKEVREELGRFFEKIKGYGKLIENYEIIGPKQDPDNPQKVIVGVNVKPYFATKHYAIDFSGTENRFEADEKD